MHSSRNLSEKFESSIKELESKIRLIDDDVVADARKKELTRKLESISDELKTKEGTLNEKIESAQKEAVDQIKPLYILTAMFSILMLLLSGQEQVHNIFPFNEMFLFAMMYILLYAYLVWSQTKTSVVFVASVVALSSILVFVFAPELRNVALLNSFIYDKYMVDAALFFAFLPFVFASFKLYIIALRIVFEYRVEHYFRRKEIDQLDDSINQLVSSLDTIGSFSAFESKE